MPRRTQFTTAAKSDLFEIWDYLADRAGVAVADRITAELRTAVKRLETSPGIGHRRPDLCPEPYRLLLVRSYYIVYDATAKPPVIIRILHAARDIDSLMRDA